MTMDKPTIQRPQLPATKYEPNLKSGYQKESTQKCQVCLVLSCPTSFLDGIRHHLRVSFQHTGLFWVLDQKQLAQPIISCTFSDAISFPSPNIKVPLPDYDLNLPPSLNYLCYFLGVDLLFPLLHHE